jgi:hypothetical protein
MLIMKGTLGILPYTKYKREAIGVKNHLKILQHPFMFEAVLRITSNKYIYISAKFRKGILMAMSPNVNCDGNGSTHHTLLIFNSGRIATCHIKSGKIKR